MIDVQLLKHPEQLAVRLTKMEKDIQALQLEIERIKKSQS